MKGDYCRTLTVQTAVYGPVRFDNGRWNNSAVCRFESDRRFGLTTPDRRIARLEESKRTGYTIRSPVLFVLYTEPIYRLGNGKGRFGYADDTAIPCIGDSLEETAAKASQYVEELVAWGTTNGITFDPKKTEIMHFSRSHIRDTPLIFHGDVEKKSDKALRWLGI